MPVIKSAKKKARQAKTHEERNKGMRTKVKTFMKKLIDTSKSNPAEAVKLLPEAYSVLDTAAKKHMLHKNTVARKKSRLARLVAAAGVSGSSAKKEPAKA